MKVLLTEKDDVAIVTLDNGVTNAITRELIKDLTNVITDAEKRYRGLLLRGNEKFFSMGFYLPELLSLSKDEFEKFYDSFNELIMKIFTLSIPTCSVLEGHAVAGGFILAIATDFRTAVSEKKIGLNEINLAVPVPFLAKELLSRLSSERMTTRLIYSGDFITTDEGLKDGIIDEVAPASDIIESTLNLINIYKIKNHRAFGIIKKSQCLGILSKFERYRDWDRKSFFDCWYSPEAQEILKETAKKF